MPPSSRTFRSQTRRFVPKPGRRFLPLVPGTALRCCGESLSSRVPHPPICSPGPGHRAGYGLAGLNPHCLFCCQRQQPGHLSASVLLMATHTICCQWRHRWQHQLRSVADRNNSVANRNTAGNKSICCNWQQLAMVCCQTQQLCCQSQHRARNKSICCQWQHRWGRYLLGSHGRG